MNLKGGASSLDLREPQPNYMPLRAFLQGNTGGPSNADGPCWVRPPLLDGEQTLKERTVALQRDAQVFGRDIVSAIPLFLEFGTLLGKDFGQAFHGCSDEAVCLLYGATGLIDEGGLNAGPTGSQLL